MDGAPGPGACFPLRSHLFLLVSSYLVLQQNQTAFVSPSTTKGSFNHISAGTVFVMKSLSFFSILSIPQHSTVRTQLSSHFLQEAPLATNFTPSTTRLENPRPFSHNLKTMYRNYLYLSVNCKFLKVKKYVLSFNFPYLTQIRLSINTTP